METNKPNLSIARNLKIATFHLGSGMADVLTTGVWNRIMISDLGFAATPIGLLVSLRYFLAPLGVWAGHASDERAIFGFRRLFWIWFGRALMVLSTFGLGISTAQLATMSESNVLWWGLIVASMLAFSFGSAVSGSTFLALIYDRAPENQRGRAVGIVWTFLLLGFTLGGIIFGMMLPSSGDADGVGYSPNQLLNLFLVAGLIFGFLWFVSLLGEERRNQFELQKSEGKHHSIRSDLALVWRKPELRFFMLYLALSMFFAFSQDLILEPFAGDVFGMEARVTNRFAAYWGSTAIIGTLLFIGLSRRVKILNNRNMSYLGVFFLVLTFAVLGISSFAEVRWLVTPALILLGLGLGIWNVGTLGLMMDMSPVGRAGTFLGFWTLVVTFSRGFGVSSGGIVRDVVLSLTNDLQAAYGVVFAIGVVGLLVSAYCLRRVNVSDFKSDVQSDQDAAAIFAGSMD